MSEAAAAVTESAATPAATPPEPSPAPTAPPAATDTATTDTAATDAASQKAAEAEAKKAAEERRWSARQNEYLKQRRELDAERLRFKQESEAHQARLKALEEYESIKAKAKENPLAPLEHFGIPLDDLVTYVTNDRKLPPEKKLQSELSEVKQELTAMRREREEAEKKRAEAEQQSRVRTLQSKIIEESRNEEKYPAIAHFQLANKVWDAMNYIFEHGEPNLGYRPGTSITVDRACEIVENHFRPHYLVQAEKFLARAKPKPPPEPATSVEAKNPAPVKATSGTSRTIDNSRATAPATAPDTRGMSAEESKKALAEWFKVQAAAKRKK